MHATLGSTSANLLSWTAVAAGALQLIGIVSLAVFFAIGEPFGTINDACIALTAVLVAALAWQLPAAPGQALALHRLALAAAGVGAVIAVFGNSLVIFHVTSFVLAGYWAQLGYTVLGLWLLAACSAASSSGDWPRGLVVLGLVTGAILLVGLLALPAVLRGLDSMADSPWYVMGSYISWLGAFFLLPAWCLWLGRLLAAR